MNIKTSIYKLMTAMAVAKPWQRALVVVAFLALLLGAGWQGYDYYLGSQRDVSTIVPYNHTEIGVGYFYVDGHWGGISDPRTGGGSSMCCVSIPSRWHPDLKVTVKWQKDGSDAWLVKQVAIPPYDDKGGEIQVHFLSHDEVKVVITNYGLRSPKNPLHDELLGKKP